jgi:hypothetical protein
MNDGVLEGPADDDRATQGKDARLLGLGLQMKVVLLVAEVDASLAVDGDRRRIDDHQLRNHLPVGDSERSHSAANLGRLVALEQQCGGAGEVEIGHHQH